jgi:glycine/D-amino acid oxidase-like deaminating enzyme
VDNPTRKVVIVGGGTAGWLTACLLACRAKTIEGTPPAIVLVESPDIPAIGVGEGTWPSMRMSLQTIGIAEADLVRHADASFKQGTQFIGWGGNEGADSYYHPFSLPAEYSQLNLAEHWLDLESRPAFADFATPQARVIAAGLAPRQASMPPYAFAVNYGYHFDAGKFAHLLHEHATAKLGVDFRSANVVGIAAAENGDIAAVELDSGERIDGDLFVDCTGQRSLLLSGHFGVEFVSVKDVLLNDTAIAVQVPWGRNPPPLPSVTRATAAPAGWIWDIGLPSRRGIGYVHSSAHANEAAALATLKDYIAQTAPAVSPDGLGFRTIRFEPGYRRDFWVKNCVAVGLSGGFMEPLEASALALIEQAAQLISRDLPASRDIMAVVAKRFNEKMHYHWQRVVEFLKLHYVLSRRDSSAYWRDTRNPSSCPAGLRDKLTLWQQQAPWHEDAPRVDELFPSASYQFVLYGMGFEPALRAARRTVEPRERALVDRALKDNEQKARQLLSGLPANRALLDAMTSLAGVA